MDAREINKAMAAHGVWKIHLREAIESGSSDYLPETVSRDNECEFGRWLYAIPINKRPAEFWLKVQKLHSLFHEEVGRILKLALEGKIDEAHSLVSDQEGVFVFTSNQLTHTLNEWKKVCSSS